MHTRIYFLYREQQNTCTNIFIIIWVCQISSLSCRRIHFWRQEIEKSIWFTYSCCIISCGYSMSLKVCVLFNQHVFICFTAPMMMRCYYDKLSKNCHCWVTSVTQEIRDMVKYTLSFRAESRIRWCMKKRLRGLRSLETSLTYFRQNYYKYPKFYTRNLYYLNILIM